MTEDIKLSTEDLNLQKAEEFLVKQEYAPSFFHYIQTSHLVGLVKLQNQVEIKQPILYDVINEEINRYSK